MISTSAPDAPVKPGKTKKPRSLPLKTLPAARLSDEEVNRAPIAWGRRLARLVGKKFAVQMTPDRSKNEGVLGRTRVVIKCAKSRSAPIFVSAQMLERSDEVWGVFLQVGEGAEIWKCDAAFVRRAAYFTHQPKLMPRAELRFKAISRGGVLIGTLSESEIESCEIP